MSQPLRLFEAFGVELEYMIVDRDTLDVRPIADELLKAAAGEIVSEVDLGVISWSNELALHVIELKTTQPAPDLAALPQAFDEQIAKIGKILEDFQARLMPTAMHPWMDPDREMRLWPHDYNPVYEAYHRIFDCHGHGWANLQSVHLNLPFCGDDEFGRLHAAIRILLPLLPALAASSPIVAAQLTGFADNRMHVYRDNSRRVPQITGAVVPEAVFTQAEYSARIFEPMYAAMQTYDPERLLCHEWLNSRGAIARFDRNAIEIRVLDIQETPAADVAICEIVVAVLKLLLAEHWTSYSEQKTIATDRLADILTATIRDAEQAEIESPEYLRQFGIEAESMSAARIWQRLVELSADQVSQVERLRLILDEGPLARRIERALKADRDSLKEIYSKLCLT